jgi:hypothetical protein
VQGLDTGRAGWWWWWAADGAWSSECIVHSACGRDPARYSAGGLEGPAPGDE